MKQILFGLFAAVAVLSALMAVTRKNAVSSACWLVLMFFGLAAVYVLLEAYFVAAVQVLVYAGAIMVLFLFVIMLLDLKASDLRARSAPHLKIAGVILSGAVLGAVLHVLRDASDSPQVADRAAASLRLPAAAPAAAGAEAAAPAPVALEPAPTAVPGGRAWTGTFPGTAAKDAPARRLDVVVAPDGLVGIALDGAVLRDVTWDAPPSAGLSRAAIAVPGAPEGTFLDLAVRRGGLDDGPGGPPDGSPVAIGKTLFERWLLPFEIVSLLLTAGIFGAVVLTKRRLA